jgi:hypothetical protein
MFGVMESMEVIFPIPRITETFIDKVIEKAGGRRLFESEKKEGVRTSPKKVDTKI